MATITLVKTNDGAVVGFCEQDQRAWAKFQRRLEGLEPGELVELSTWFDRSPPYHRRHMAMLRDIFDAQERFSDFYEFRKWTEAGAGHGEFMPGLNGQLVFIPKSIAYHKVDQAEMEVLHGKVKVFLRSAHATRWLWPHLTEHQQWEMIEQLLYGFER